MASGTPAKSSSGPTSLGKRTSQIEEADEKRPKITFGVSNKSSAKSATTSRSSTGLQIKLNTTKSKTAQPLLKTSTVFNDESDEEPQEMPPEAKMRMRNIGRDTPTSAGPNSFGKTKHGFCNAKKLFEKNLTSEAESISNDTKDKSKKTT